VTIPATPSSSDAATSALNDLVTGAQKAAGTLVPTLPRYRAGLVASIAAGCASLKEIVN
jgi:hypothetical protein